MKCLKTDTHALLVNISVTSNSEKQHLTKTKLTSLVLCFFFQCSEIYQLCKLQEALVHVEMRMCT